MFRFFRGFSFAVVVAVLSLTFVQVSFAADSENSLTGFFRKLFHYPVKATQETAGMTANTLKNTGEKVVAVTGENTAAVVTGDLSKTGDLVAQPVVGILETAGQTASETVQVPVKAAEDDKPL